MTESEALARMIPPIGHRPSKPYRGCVIQIHVTRACDKTCYGCTQGSNLGGKTHFMSPAHFEQALVSLEGFQGVVGVFGGNPAVSPFFATYCDLLSKYFPREQRGLWCNNPITLENAHKMRETFDPRVSNLNCHLDSHAYALFKRGWPESMPFGQTQDSRHSPPWVAMKDVLWKDCPDCHDKDGVRSDDAPEMCYRCDGEGHFYDESLAWDLISNCDINRQWSASIGMFRGQLRAWFCEIAMAQSILHQDEPDYPDTGLDPTVAYEHHTRPGERLEKTLGQWWELGMPAFAGQVRKHCHECGIPLRGHGELAQASDEKGKEQVSATHQAIFRPKRKSRAVELVTTRSQLGEPLANVTRYVQNASK